MRPEKASAQQKYTFLVIVPEFCQIFLAKASGHYREPCMCSFLIPGVPGTTWHRKHGGKPQQTAGEQDCDLEVTVAGRSQQMQFCVCSSDSVNAAE